MKQFFKTFYNDYLGIILIVMFIFFGIYTCNKALEPEFTAIITCETVDATGYNSIIVKQLSVYDSIYTPIVQFSYASKRTPQGNWYLTDGSTHHSPFNPNIVRVNIIGVRIIRTKNGIYN